MKVFKQSKFILFVISGDHFRIIDKKDSSSSLGATQLENTWDCLFNFRPTYAQYVIKSFVLEQGKFIKFTL